MLWIIGPFLYIKYELCLAEGVLPHCIDKLRTGKFVMFSYEFATNYV